MNLVPKLDLFYNISADHSLHQSCMQNSEGIFAWQSIEFYKLTIFFTMQPGNMHLYYMLEDCNQMAMN